MTATTITRHAAVRMAQRGIPLKDAELIQLIGSEVDDGYLVRDKDCQAVERLMKSLLQRVQHLKGKRLVIAEGRIITAYHAGPRQKRRLLRQTCKRNFKRSA